MTPAPSPPPAPADLHLGTTLFRRIARYRGPVELGWFDFVLTYRRSFFGPLWTIFQLIAWIATIVLIFGDRLGQGIESYALYVGIGMIAWDLISSVLSEGPRHITQNTGLIKNTQTELSVISVRKLSNLLFKAAFHTPVVIALIFFFGDGYSINMLLIIPAIFVYAVNVYIWIVILGFTGALFRDFEFVIPALIRFLFFTTPIFWSGDVGIRKFFSTYNPLSYFLEIFRTPLLGGVPTTTAWVVVFVLTLCGGLSALWVQTQFRKTIIFRL